MYSQFFGNYLLTKNAITPEQLIHAIQEQHSKHLRLGTLAIHAGYMTAEQIDEIVIRQTHEDRRFGELAIESGYLTEAQMTELLSAQTPDYLLIGQSLVDDGVLTTADLEKLIISYQKENELSSLTHASEQSENLEALIRNLFLITLEDIPQYVIEYLQLLFNNLIRFIGEDFTPLRPSMCNQYITSRCSGQIISGEISLTSYFDLTEDAAVSFASRYAGETFDEFDEFVQASIEDFLNLHNGLFNVNMSNTHSVELSLEAPVSMENTMLSSSEQSLLLPIVYPYGTLNFLVKF